MKRVLALLGAILLIVAAVVLRGVLDDSGSQDDGGDDGDGDGELVVACIPELRDACEAIDRDLEALHIEDPGETIARLEAGEELDAWVTLDPWPEIAGFEPEVDRFLDDDPVGVASSQLSLVTRDDVAGQCGEPPEWTCVVELVPGRVAVAPPDTAVGRLVLGWVAFEWIRTVGQTDELTRAELEQPELQSFLDDIDLSERDPLRTALELGRPGPLALGTTAADARSIQGTREEGMLLPDTGGFPASVAVVVVGPDADRVAGEPAFTEELERSGWTLDPSARSAGLPSAGVLYALADFVG